MRHWTFAALFIVATVSLGGYAFARSNSVPKASYGWTAYAPLASIGRGSSSPRSDRLGGVLPPREAPSARNRGAYRVSSPGSYGIDIQAVFDNAGDPILVANFTPDGGLATPTWSICHPPDVHTCAPASRKIELGGELDAGRQPAGTVFQATATYHGHTYLARSSPWQGAVHATAPARLLGRARYGASVKPRGATWTGGWGSEFDYLRVEACRTPDAKARSCVTLSAPGEGFGFSNRPPVVGAWYTGWYLFALDARLAHDTVFAEPGYGFPVVVPPLKVGPTVARSAPSGPVIGPNPPKVSFLRAAMLSAGRVLVARVRCSVRCRIFLQVDDDYTGSDAHFTLTGSGLVGVPRRQLRRGLLNSVILVDTGPPVRGRSRLR
jgi:hypothetical protein